MVRHVSREVIIRILGQLDLCRTVVNQRCVLIRLAADETVKILKAGVRWPSIVRTCGRYFPRWRFMILAIRSGAVPVLSENLGHRRN